jgi:hypothetical protein
MARYLVLAVLPLCIHELRCNAASRTSSFEKPAGLAAPEARIRATPPHINRRPTKLWLRMPARSVVHVTCKRCDIVHCRRAVSNGSSSSDTTEPSLNALSRALGVSSTTDYHIGHLVSCGWCRLKLVVRSSLNNGYPARCQQASHALPKIVLARVALCSAVPLQ